jgi:broad specificity phosphatase PhoE
MSLHTMPRTFYLTRHGQSEYNLSGKIGGDSGLSPNGLEYAKRLAKYAEENIGIKEEIDENGTKTKVSQPARLWTSTLIRTKETAQFIKHNELEYEYDNGDKVSWVNFRPNARRNLDELYAGLCDGMTYKEIEEVYPTEFAARQNDKLKYRYQRGESYLDVMQRLEPLALDMERVSQPVLIVCHQGILRILLAYFTGLSREDAPFVKIPLNHVTKLTPQVYGCDQEMICLLNDCEMVDDGQDEPTS